MRSDRGHDSSKVALVTGGSRGLGLALVEHLSAEGWLVIADARDRERLDSAIDSLEHRERVVAIAGDVTDADHRRELVRAAGAACGLDLLVNNASALGPSPLPALVELSLRELDAIMATNAFAPLALAQEAAELLDIRDGILVNVTSDAAVGAYPGWGGYGASKAALDQLTAIWAAEHPERRVYAFDPGDLATEMHQAAFPGEDISDRPEPAEAVPGLVRLVRGDLPSGRYGAHALREGAEA